jgi:hypothetical protein
MELSHSWEATSRSATPEIPQHFMETESSLPWSQDSATDPYTETYESGPYYSILFLEDPF